ncbi:MAG: ABC transporter substrate-binding protein, partial [Anaerolineaceae bacterium]
PITKAEAVDDFTLKLTLDAPFYPILESLTSSYAGVWSQKAIEEAGDQYGWTVAVGAGPYIFEDWVQDEKITLVRNPDFTWGPIMYEGCNPGPYNIERLEWRFVPDSATVLASLEAGELGYASVSPNDMETIEGTGMYEVVSGLDTNFRYLEFNLVNPPFNDVHVRRAFNYMINRDEVIDVVCMGQCVKILSSMSPAMIGYWPGIEEIGLDYNPEKAKEEFIAAGYSYADDGTLLNPDGTAFEADLWTDAGDTVWINWSEVMERQFAAQGVKVNIKMLEWNALADKLSSGDFQMDTMSMDWNEADVLYLMYHSTSGWWSQIGELQNQELDALLEATRTETDPAARQEAVNTALKYVTEQALIAPVMATNFFVAIDKNIEGWEFSPFTGVIFADAFFNDL